MKDTWEGLNTAHNISPRWDMILHYTRYFGNKASDRLEYNVPEQIFSWTLRSYKAVTGASFGLYTSDMRAISLYVQSC